MFCDNCGKNNNAGNKFCTKCGQVFLMISKVQSESEVKNQIAWWYRLAKVTYIAMFAPLILIVLTIWIESGVPFVEQLFFTFLTLVIYGSIMRLIKIAFHYVVLGDSPDWSSEIRRLF